MSQEMSITFTSNGKSFAFNLALFEKGGLMHELAMLSPGEPIPFQGDHEELVTLAAFLRGEPCDERGKEFIGKYGIIPFSYESCLILENEMRENMYVLPDAAYDDPHYGLVKVEPETFASPIEREKTRDLLFSSASPPLLDDWSSIEDKLRELRKFTSIPGVFIAGGCIYSVLFGRQISDIDLFFWGMTQAEADATILAVRDVLSEIFGNSFVTIIRTENAITFTFQRGLKKYIAKEVQIILRLYHTPSAVLHGFDVDSCCIGYDGKNIWATHRALYAIQRGINTFSFERLSPSYEARLVKYGARGMAVQIPDFDVSNVDVEELNVLYEDKKGFRHAIHDSKGLRRLVLSDYYFYMQSRKKYVDRRFHDEASVNCDYNPVSWSKDTPHNRSGSKIDSLIIHLLSDCKDEHRPQALRYVKVLADSGLLFFEGYFDDDDGLLTELGYSDEYVEKLLDVDECDDEIFDSFAECWGQVWTNSLRQKKGEFKFFKVYNLRDLHLILDLNPTVYSVLECVYPVRPPRKLVWKTINPGEQMTNSFHVIVLKDRSVWYNI